MNCPKCKKEDTQNSEMCPACGAPVKPISTPPGGKIRFGKYDWFVLAKQDGRTLVISEKVVGKRAYHREECDITWETCDMRQYLNGEFYDSFDATDRARIVEVTNENRDNPWHGTNGGNPTTDKIFLLSIEETLQYLGDGTGAQKLKEPPQWINDANNKFRRGKLDKKAVWLWLRSPGFYARQAIYANALGHISVGGDRVGRVGGVRPALWLTDL